MRLKDCELYLSSCAPKEGVRRGHLRFGAAAPFKKGRQTVTAGHERRQGSWEQLRGNTFYSIIDTVYFKQVYWFCSYCGCKTDRALDVQEMR